MSKQSSPSSRSSLSSQCLFQRGWELLRPVLAVDGLRLPSFVRCRRRLRNDMPLNEDFRKRLCIDSGDQVLIVGGATNSSVHIGQSALAAGAQVSIVDISDSALAEFAEKMGEQRGERDNLGLVRRCREDPGEHCRRHSGHYSLVVVAGNASLTAAEANLESASIEAVARDICSAAKPGGSVLILDAAPASSLLRLVAPSAVRRPDWAALLPVDMQLRSRCRSGSWPSSSEALLATRIPGGPRAVAAAVERLRRMYGSSSMAYCASPDAERVGTPEKLLRYYLSGRPGSETGYIAYLDQVVCGQRLRCVVMDPVCRPDALEELLAGFIAESEAVQARPMFTCLSAEAVPALAARGFHATKLGGEIAIPLAQYKATKERRRYLRIAEAKGLECFEICYDMEELEELNNTWVASKASGEEAAILTWPPSMPQPNQDAAGDEVFRLFTYLDGELVGFVCAEPFYKGDGSGQLLGYGLNTIRFKANTSPAWASDFTIATLVEKLQTRGQAEFLAFGISPFTELAPHPTDHSLVRGAAELLWDLDLNCFYSFVGLAKKKAHHCAGQGVHLQDRFFCSPRSTAFLDFLCFVTLLGGSSAGRKIPPEILRMMMQASGRLVSALRSSVIGLGARLFRRGRECATVRHVPKRGQVVLGVGKAPDVVTAEAFVLITQPLIWAVALGPITLVSMALLL